MFEFLSLEALSQETFGSNVSVERLEFNFSDVMFITLPVLVQYKIQTVNYEKCCIFYG